MSEEKNSVERRKTRYVAGGDTEVSDTGLEWWERSVFASADDDKPYVIEKKFEGRLDLMAAFFLGDPRMWWVIAQYNSVLDPHGEIREGATIYIPSKERAETILGAGRTGGLPSTREVPVSILPIV